MRTTTHQALLKIVTFLLFTIIVHPSHSYASVSDENEINKIFETHGKKNVVQLISKKRKGKITIEKNKSFLNVSRKPDINLVTAKSIIQDLKILKMEISELKNELDTFIEDEKKKREDRENSLNYASTGERETISLTQQLELQIKDVQSKYNKTDSISERSRLSKELSKLRRSLRNAKKDNQSRSRTHIPDSKADSHNCISIKEKLQKLTEPSYRHEIFFCGDRSYRKENPDLCKQSRYVRPHTIEEHTDEIRKLRLQESKNCK